MLYTRLDMSIGFIYTTDDQEERVNWDVSGISYRMGSYLNQMMPFEHFYYIILLE